LNIENHSWKKIANMEEFKSNNNLLKNEPELIAIEGNKLRNLENIDITNVTPYSIFCLLFTAICGKIDLRKRIYMLSKKSQKPRITISILIILDLLGGKALL